MDPLRFEELFEMRLEIGDPEDLGATPLGERRIVPIIGGTFQGPKMQGTVVPGGADWWIQRPDGTVHADVRLALRTQDNASIGMTYRGIRYDNVEPVGSRIVVFFETGSQEYAWLNRIVAAGAGHREGGVVYASVYAIL